MVSLPLERLSEGESDERPQTFSVRSSLTHRGPREDDGKPKSTHVNVFARFKPQSPLEEEKGGKLSCFFDPDGRTVSVSGDRGLATFQFSGVFQPAAGQGEVYTNVAQPIVNKVVAGINAAIIAYGQTGSGKTHSMIGSFDGAWGDDREVPNDAEGMVPRALRDLFFAVANSPPHINYSVFASLVEIYQENITDLLSTDSTRGFLAIREDRRRRLFITDAAQFPVTTAREVLNLIHRGMRARETARTKMNERSSRSHAVVILNVERRDAVEGTLTTSQLYMVDLAGSEVVSKTEASGTVLEEAKCINSSLFALGRVISALSEGATHVPYRDSKLTRLLQHCFGGSSSTALLINCSSSSYNRQETVASLQLGARSQKIVNKVVVDTVFTPAELKSMLNDARKTISRQAAELSVQERELALLRREATQLRLQLHQQQLAPSTSPRPEEGGAGAGEGMADCEAQEASLFADGSTGAACESQAEVDGGGHAPGESGRELQPAARAAGGRRLEEEPWCEPRFLCPISGRLMRSPTLLADGNTYEECIARRYVSGAYASDPRSPLTGEPLAHAHLTPNTFARMLIQRSCPYDLAEIAPSVSLTLFPAVLELAILAWLDYAPLCRLACTCRHLRAVADQDELWRPLLLSGRHFRATEERTFSELHKAQFQRRLRASRLSPQQADDLRRKLERAETARSSRGLTLQPSNVYK